MSSRYPYMRNEDDDILDDESSDGESSAGGDTDLNGSSKNFADELESIGDLTRFAAEYLKNRDSTKLKALESAIEHADDTTKPTPPRSKASRFRRRSHEDDCDDTVFSAPAEPSSSKSPSLLDGFPAISKSVSTRNWTTFGGRDHGHGHHHDDSDDDEKSVSTAKSTPLFGNFFSGLRDEDQHEETAEEPDAAAGGVSRRTKPTTQTQSAPAAISGGGSGNVSWASSFMVAPKSNSPSGSPSAGKKTVQKNADHHDHDMGAGFLNMFSRGGSHEDENKKHGVDQDDRLNNFFATSFRVSNPAKLTPPPKRESSRNASFLRPSSRDTTARRNTRRSSRSSIPEDDDDDYDDNVTIYTTQTAPVHSQHRESEFMSSMSSTGSAQDTNDMRPKEGRYRVQGGKLVEVGGSLEQSPPPQQKSVTSKPKEGRYKLRGGKLVPVFNKNFNFEEEEGQRKQRKPRIKKTDKHGAYTAPSKASKTESSTGSVSSVDADSSGRVTQASLLVDWKRKKGSVRTIKASEIKVEENTHEDKGFIEWKW